MFAPTYISNLTAYYSVKNDIHFDVHDMLCCLFLFWYYFTEAVVIVCTLEMSMCSSEQIFSV